MKATVPGTLSCRIEGRLLLAALFFFVTGAVLALDAPHDMSNNIHCGSCHVSHGSLGNPLVNTAAVNNLCLSCHNGTIATATSTHASAKDFTFSLKCSTCHDPHGGTPVGANLNFIRLVIETPNSGELPVTFETQGAGGDYARGAGNGYDGVCEVCHTLTTTHRNNASGDHAHNSTADCITCHAHSDPQNEWGFKGAGDCISCHADPQPTSSPTRRAVTGASGDFVKNSHHINDGTGTELATGEHCTVCHAEGDDGSLNETYHGNGDVELKDADGGVVYNIEDGTGESGTGSSSDDRDLTLFCLSCHDSDGASVTALAGTSAVNPFNDLITNSHELDLDDVQVVVQRGNVIDVQGQFDPNVGADGGNPVSHHNVLAKRYTNWADGGGVQGIDDRTFTGVSLLNGPVSEGGTGTQGSEGLIECADCHTSNAHGADGRYFLLDSGGTDSTWTDSTLPCFRCHEQSVYMDSNNPNAGWSGINHALNSGMGFNSDNDGSNHDRTIYRLMCLQCHGGRTFGRIHGNTESTITPERRTPKGAPATYTPYRFTNGASMDYIDDREWETAASRSCMTVATTNNINLECKQHGGQSFSKNYARPLQY